MSAITHPAALERIAAQTTAGAARKARAETIWDPFTLGRALREREITRRAAHAQLDKIEAEVARQLAAARAIAAVYESTFADAPREAGDARDAIEAAWNAAHDMVTALECDRSSAAFADGMDTTPEATRELIRENRD